LPRIYSQQNRESIYGSGAMPAREWETKNPPPADQAQMPKWEAERAKPHYKTPARVSALTDEQAPEIARTPGQARDEAVEKTRQELDALTKDRLRAIMENETVRLQRNLTDREKAQLTSMVERDIFQHAYGDGKTNTIAIEALRGMKAYKALLGEADSEPIRLVRDTAESLQQPVAASPAQAPSPVAAPAAPKMPEGWTLPKGSPRHDIVEWVRAKNAWGNPTSEATGHRRSATDEEEWKILNGIDLSAPPPDAPAQAPPQRQGTPGERPQNQPLKVTTPATPAAAGPNDAVDYPKMRAEQRVEEWLQSDDRQAQDIRYWAGRGASMDATPYERAHEMFNEKRGHWKKVYEWEAQDEWDKMTPAEKAATRKELDDWRGRNAATARGQEERANNPKTIEQNIRNSKIVSQYGETQLAAEKLAGAVKNSALRKLLESEGAILKADGSMGGPTRPTMTAGQGTPIDPRNYSERDRMSREERAAHDLDYMAERARKGQPVGGQRITPEEVESAREIVALQQGAAYRRKFGAIDDQTADEREAFAAEVQERHKALLEGTEPINAAQWLEDFAVDRKRLPFLGAVLEGVSNLYDIAAIKTLRTSTDPQERLAAFKEIYESLVVADAINRRGMTGGAKLAEGTANLVPYMIEFAVTSGAVAGARKAGRSAMISFLRGMGLHGNSRVARALVATAGYGSQALAQTFTRPHEGFQMATEYAKPTVHFADGGKTLIVDAEGDSGIKAVLKGYAKSLIQTMGEQSGGLITKAVGKATGLSKLSVAVRGMLAKTDTGKAILELSKTNPVMAAGKLDDYFAELSEEEATRLALSVTGLERYPNMTAQDRAIEFLTLLAPQAANVAINYGTRKTGTGQAPAPAVQQPTPAPTVEPTTRDSRVSKMVVRATVEGKDAPVDAPAPVASQADAFAARREVAQEPAPNDPLGLGAQEAAKISGIDRTPTPTKDMNASPATEADANAQPDAAKVETKPVAETQNKPVRPTANDKVLRNANSYALGDKTLAETLESARNTNPMETARYARDAAEYHRTEFGSDPEMAKRYDVLANAIEKKLMAKPIPVAAKVEGAKAKEPWEMTQKEFDAALEKGGIDRASAPDDLWYGRKIDPSQYGVYGYSVAGGGRGELQIRLPKDSDPALLKKLDETLGKPDAGSPTKRTYYMSNSRVGSAAVELPAMIIRGWHEKSGWARAAKYGKQAQPAVETGAEGEKGEEKAGSEQARGAEWTPDTIAVRKETRTDSSTGEDYEQTTRLVVQNGVLREQVLKNGEVMRDTPMNDPGREKDLQKAIRSSIRNGKNWEATGAAQKALAEQTNEQAWNAERARLEGERKAITDKLELDYHVALKKAKLFGKAKEGTAPQDKIDAIQQRMKDDHQAEIRASINLQEQIAKHGKLDPKTYQAPATESKPVEQGAKGKGGPDILMGGFPITPTKAVSDAIKSGVEKSRAAWRQLAGLPERGLMAIPAESAIGRFRDFVGAINSDRYGRPVDWVEGKRVAAGEERYARLQMEKQIRAYAEAAKKSEIDRRDPKSAYAIERVLRGDAPAESLPKPLQAWVEQGRAMQDAESLYAAEVFDEIGMPEKAQTFRDNVGHYLKNIPLGTLQRPIMKRLFGKLRSPRLSEAWGKMKRDKWILRDGDNLTKYETEEEAQAAYVSAVEARKMELFTKRAMNKEWKLTKEGFVPTREGGFIPWSKTYEGKGGEPSDLYRKAARNIEIIEPIPESWRLENEVHDPAYLLARSIIETRHDAELAKLFSQAAEKWGQKAPANMDEAEADLWAKDRGLARLPQSGRLHNLKGMYVPKPMAADLTEMVKMPGALMKIYKGYMAAFKSSKTIYNPATHARNVMGNFIFAYLSGTSAWNPANVKHYVNGVRELKTKGADYEFMVKHGVIGTEYFGSELQRLDTQLQGVEPTKLSQVLGGLKSVHNAVGEVYGLGDQVFKMASYKKYRAEGMSPQEAADEVNKWFPNYAETGRLTRILRESPVGAPFISFTDQAVRIAGRAAKEHPVRLAAVAALPGMLSMFSVMALGMGDEEKELVDSGRSYFEPLIPWRDEQGRAQTVDVRYIMPLANDLMIQEERGPISLPWLMSTPLASTAIEQFSGRERFSGRDFVREDMTTGERWKARGEQLYKTAGPTPPLAGYGAKRIWNAATGWSGEPVSQAIIGTLSGVNVRNPYIAERDLRRKLKSLFETDEPEKVELARNLIQLWNDTYKPKWFDPIKESGIWQGIKSSESREQEKATEEAARWKVVGREDKAAEVQNADPFKVSQAAKEKTERPSELDGVKSQYGYRLSVMAKAIYNGDKAVADQGPKKLNETKTRAMPYLDSPGKWEDIEKKAKSNEAEKWQKMYNLARDLQPPDWTQAGKAAKVLNALGKGQGKISDSYKEHTKAKNKKGD
jgi:hypothetical protein